MAKQNIVDQNGVVLERNLPLDEAEHLLCRFLNEDVDAYLADCDESALSATPQHPVARHC